MWNVVGRIMGARNDVLRCLHRPRAKKQQPSFQTPTQPSPKGGCFSDVSYGPHTAVSSFQPSEPVQTGAASVARVSRVEQG